MRSKGMTSPEAAARLVFAPEEEIPAENGLVIRAKAPAKRHKSQPAAAYNAQFVKASTITTPATDWRRTLDISWLLGRATA